MVNSGAHVTKFPTMMCRILETAVDIRECLKSENVTLNANFVAQKLGDP